MDELGELDELNDLVSREFSAGWRVNNLCTSGLTKTPELLEVVGASP